VRGTKVLVGGLHLMERTMNLATIKFYR